MAIAVLDGVTEDPEAARLDEEIADLKSQVQELKSLRAIQISNVITSRSSQVILSRLRASSTTTVQGPQISSHAPSTSTTTPSDSNPLHPALFNKSKKQLAHNQECIYRTCAGITTFKVKDPDPYAVDNGNVLGLRFEAFANGKYIRPYYVLLNKPYPGTGLLRIHRHTVPPCIPLAVLASKYLPTPSTPSVDHLKTRKQDLTRFARTLRREVASYHNRLRAIAGLRKGLGLDDKEGKGKRVGSGINDVSAADAEAKQVRFEWDDGRIGRALIGGKGEVLRTVIIGEEGRDRDMERRILGADKRLESLAERILGH